MLNKRLLTIADLIPENKTVFDVGTDHALLPCFLAEKKNCFVYAGDNKQGPLDKAIDNIVKRKLENKVIPLLSDGLQKASDDVEIVVIAGMGYNTAKDIMEAANLKQYDKIIVQVNKDVDLLRQFISDHHYTICDEEIVKDDFYYEIVAFNTIYHESYSPLECRYGPLNLKKRTGIFLEYLQYKMDKLKIINQQAQKDDYIDRIEEMNKIIVDSCE